jgi:hypothetical protein
MRSQRAIKESLERQNAADRQAGLKTGQVTEKAPFIALKPDAL